MPDYTVSATRGTAVSYGSAAGVLRVRAPQSMTAMETTVARYDVEQYTVSAGGFLPGRADITVSVSVGGAVSASAARSWESLAGRGMSLWDGGECRSIWSPVSGSDQVPMYGASNSVAAVLPSVPADASCTHRFRAALTRAGAAFETGPGVQAQGFWALLAARPSVPSNGSVMTIGLHTQAVGIAYDAGSLVFRLIDGEGSAIVIGHHKMDATGKYVPVIGIGTGAGVLRITIRDSPSPTTYTWDIGGVIVADRFVVGGTDSPELVLYAAAMGTGGSMEFERYMRLISGSLS